jgi:tetratricopeptide (TPR) repeat protein
MNRDSLLRGIFWIVLASSFLGLIFAGYAIHDKQADKIELLKKNLKETHRILNETKNELLEARDNAGILAAKKDGLIEKVSLQEGRIEKFQREKKSLEEREEGLSAQKRELETALEKTRKSLEKRIRTQELKIAELRKDFQKKSAVEKAMFSAQKEKLNEQVTAAEVLLETLTKKNKELLSKARENKHLLVRLIEESEGEIGAAPIGAMDKRDLREKISNLNKMIAQNKKLITKNEKIIINVSGEKERIADKLRQTEEQFKKKALKLHYNLGLAYDEVRQYDKALAEYEKALKINRLDPDLHYNTAIIYDEYFHDMVKAIEHYAAYLELSPGAEDADKVAHWLEKAKQELKYSR